jgi:hypothetical protein
MEISNKDLLQFYTYNWEPTKNATLRPLAKIERACNNNVAIPLTVVVGHLFLEHSLCAAR